MGTFKKMLSVMCCWCLCLSLTSFSIAEESNKIKEKPNKKAQMLLEQKIALEKERVSSTPSTFDRNENKARLTEKEAMTKDRLANTRVRFDKNTIKEELRLKKEVHSATFEAPVRHERFSPAPSNQSRDGVVEAVVSTDTYVSEVFWILLDTTNWWAWGADGWTQASSDYNVWSASVPAGGYLFILADSFGDGGATATLTVNGEDAGSVSTASGDPQGPYEPFLFEASLGLTVTDADSSDDGGDDGAGDDGGDDGAGDDGGDDGGDVVVDATVTFNLDGVDDCGFVSVTGTWDEFSGWGAHTDTGMTAQIPAGDHEFVILCVNTVGEWWNDIWGNSTVINAPIDGACWNGNYDYANYTLTVGSDDMTVSYCAGTCDEVCAEPDPCADAPYPSWAGDGYCDTANNVADCYDGGDCCESTCVDGTYSCDTSGGCNGECLDPNGNDDACAPPACTDTEFDCLGDGTECIYGSWECDGWSDCSNGADEADCAALTCEDQGLVDCGDGQCIPASYFCDGSSEFGNAGWGPDCANGADETLEGCCDAAAYADVAECGAGDDGGADDGGTDGGGDPNEGLCYDDPTFNFDVDGDGYVDDNVLCDYYIVNQWYFGYDCDFLVYNGIDCTNVDSCGGCEAPEPDPCADAGGNSGWLSDGYCDSNNNIEACGYDGGDCCPSTCVDATYSCDSAGGTCATCIDPAAEDANYGGSCADGPVCGDGVCEDGEVGGDSGCYADCGCLEGEFECVAGGSYGNCIPGGWQCDGWDDCADVADEAGCGDLTCEDQGLWDCGDGQCINLSWVCDGSVDTCNAGWGPDCANGADESLETCGEDHDECVEVDCDLGWATCLSSLDAYDYYNGTNWYEDCSACADTCAQNPDVPQLTADCGAHAYNIGAGVCPDPCAAPADPCAEAGGNPAWIGDGYCDGDGTGIGNNQAACDFDGGDCCPGDCVDDVYLCETFGGTCEDCLDPDSADFDEGGACSDLVLGCTNEYADNYNPDATSDDGSCLFEGCEEAGTLPGCSEQDAEDDCVGSGWVGDGLCDGYTEAWGVNLCCYGLDGGDCTEAECAAPAEWDATITGLAAETTDFDPYGDGNTFPAVNWTWDALTDGTACEDNGQVTCSDGSCADSAEECPEIPYADCLGNISWIGDGYCDPGNNNAECGFDAGDCCPTSCEELVANGCPDNPAGCYTTISCGDCGTCDDPDSADLAEGGACSDYEQATDEECAASVTITGSADLTGDGYLDSCYSDGSGYYAFDWEGGCVATSLFYVDADGYEQNLDIAANQFSSGFYFYGFGFSQEIPFVLSFAEASTDLILATTDCEAAPEGCGDGYWDCGDGECIPASYLCDGSSEFGNAGWGPDCANGADETLEGCCDAASYADVAECGGSADDGGEPEGCAADQFDCGDGQCIPTSYYCDGSSEFGNAFWGPDCTNGADEVLADCCAAEAGAYAGYCGDDSADDGGEPEGCADDQYDCGADNGGCIPASWECDVYYCDCNDCVDESDCGSRDNNVNPTSRNAISTNKALNAKIHAETYAEYKKSTISYEKVEKVAYEAILDIRSGEITYTSNHDANRAVSYTVNVACESCVGGGPWGGTFTAQTSEFLIWGADAGSTLCASVVGVSDVLGVTAESEVVCGDAGQGGGGTDCVLFDCEGNCADGNESWIGDGLCDDGTWGLYFNCEEFECDNGDCLDECGECNGDGSSCACTAGDVTGDDDVNVQDIVVMVGYILDGSSADAVESCGDTNADGSVNVQDIVVVVNVILGGRTTSDATEASLNINDGIASLDANGFVGAVQMTLSHKAGFSIELTNKAMVADYRTNGNSTTLIIVAPESDELFTASGSFNVEEIIVANENSQVTVMMPTALTLSKAYPNPFNPSTSMNIFVPADGAVSLSVYNVMGQEVATLHSGNMSAGSHTVTWNASDMTSGMYFVRAESQAGVAVQKVMLMK